jgi:hypothetical protein
VLLRTKATVFVLRRKSASCGHCLRLVQLLERNNGIAAAWNADTQQGTHGSRGLIQSGGTKAEIRNAAATTSRCVGSEKVASRSGDRPAIISRQ